MNQHVVITGASRGIGLALTEYYLNQGYKVFATCRDPGRADSLRDLSGDLSIEKLDVTDPQDLAHLKTSLTGQTVDILINNAGSMGGDHQSLMDMDANTWLETFAVNSIAPFQVATQLLGNLKASDHARIISLSSQMGSLSRVRGDSYAYRSSKAALNKIMSGMACDLSGDKIIVCPVHPGWVRTDMGGPDADISIEQSVTGLFKRISTLTMVDSGKFWCWDGTEHNW